MPFGLKNLAKGPKMTHFGFTVANTTIKDDVKRGSQRKPESEETNRSHGLTVVATTAGL